MSGMNKAMNTINDIAITQNTTQHANLQITLSASSTISELVSISDSGSYASIVIFISNRESKKNVALLNLPKFQTNYAFHGRLCY